MIVETINQRIAHLRKLKEFTQSDMAERLGMKCSTYSQMERKGKIDSKMLIKLAVIFNVPPEYLIYGTPVEHKRLGEPTVPPLPDPPKPPLIIDPPPPPEPLILTKNEENIIKIYRNAPKKDKDAIMDVVDEVYQRQLKKGKTEK